MEASTAESDSATTLPSTSLPRSASISALEQIDAEVAPMRIYLFSECFWPYCSGSSRRLWMVAEKLLHMGHHLHIVTGHDGAVDWPPGQVENCTFSIMPGYEPPGTGFTFCVPWVGMISSQIREFSPDVIHVVEETLCSVVHLSVAHVLGVPAIWSHHTLNYVTAQWYLGQSAAQAINPSFQWILRRFSGCARANLAVSAAHAESLRTETRCKTDVHVWTTGVSDDFGPHMRDAKWRAEMLPPGTPTDVPLMVTVGRLAPEKELEFLLPLMERVPEVYLCMVGDGPARAQLESLLPKARTVFLGRRSGEELAKSYATGDVFVHTSTTETFGQVYLEAMKSGTPVVAAPGLQLQEFCHDSEHGQLFKAHDVDDAERALRQGLRKRDFLSVNCVRDSAQYTWQKAADEVQLIYQAAKGTGKQTWRFTGWWVTTLRVIRELLVIVWIVVLTAVAVALMALTCIRIQGTKDRRMTGGKLNVRNQVEIQKKKNDGKISPKSSDAESKAEWSKDKLPGEKQP